tara:strand:- start:30 stop:434 length:405 start_codon:yes stop_codon:yes gene_type:complete
MGLMNYRRRRKRATLVPNKTPVVVEKLSNILNEEIKNFYKCIEWKILRKEYMNENKAKFFQCNYCGEDVSKCRSLNIDHIKPLKSHWHLRLDKSNLQILCKDCNKFKGSKQNDCKFEAILNKKRLIRSENNYSY